MNKRWAVVAYLAGTDAPVPDDQLFWTRRGAQMAMQFYSMLGLDAVLRYELVDRRRGGPRHGDPAD